MSEEMKLITALCEALGFKVEIELDYKESRMTDAEFDSMNMSYGDRLHIWRQNSGRSFKSEGLLNTYFRNDDGERVTVLNKPITSYKLINKT